MWSSLNGPPAPDEVEVTVIGPGHGESVVVHLGSGEWMVVDSCVETEADSRRAVPIKYLRALGVKVETAVRLIVATHWDDDHVRGIAEVVEVCGGARFCCSPALTQRDFIAYVRAKALGSAATDGARVRDMRRLQQLLHDRGQSMVKAVPAKTLFPKPLVRTWSPGDRESDLFLEFLAATYPKHGESMSKATPGSPNLTSIVISVDWDDTSALLGADMETHADGNRGWGAVVTECGHVGFKKAELVKVPHHGSHTGHDQRMWSGLLAPKPISVVAPFGKGPIETRPPKPSDIHRIRNLSSAFYLTAPNTKPPLPARDYAVVRSLREGRIRTTSRKSPLGMVQLRRRSGGSWQSKLFGAANQVT